MFSDYETNEIQYKSQSDTVFNSIWFMRSFVLPVDVPVSEVCIHEPIVGPTGLTEDLTDDRIVYTYFWPMVGPTIGQIGW